MTMIERVLQLINESGMTKDEFCYKTGVSHNTLNMWSWSKYRDRYRNIRTITAKKIADTFGVRVEWILDGSEPKYISNPLTSKEKRECVSPIASIKDTICIYVSSLDFIHSLTSEPIKNVSTDDFQSFSKQFFLDRQIKENDCILYKDNSTYYLFCAVDETQIKENVLYALYSRENVSFNYLSATGDKITLKEYSTNTITEYDISDFKNKFFHIYRVYRIIKDL